MLAGLTVAALAAVGAISGGSPVTAAAPTLMTPVGGGYEVASIEGFVDAVASRASAPVVDLVVIPSSYGDTDADREENLALAQQRTEEIDAVCDARVRAPFTGCTSTLAVLLNRADALDPSNSAVLAAAGTDGAYILGGDQTVAMKVLARSPAENQMRRAAYRGVVFGGTSAGNAVESRTMLAGYVGDEGPAEGLRRASIDIWWGDDNDRQRGLAFGSTAAVYDQHFFQRGRFGRLLAGVAESDEHFDGTSLLGVGVDYATGVRNLGDQTLGPVFGDSAMAVIDGETLGASHEWVGWRRTLSSRNVLVHLLTPGTASYDLRTRTVRLGDHAVAGPDRRPWTLPHLPRGAKRLILGGDVSDRIPSAVAGEFALAAKGFVRPRIVVIAARKGDTRTARSYAAALREAGWAGAVTSVGYATPEWNVLSTEGAAGVVVVAPDPVALQVPMRDPVFTARVREAVRTVPVVMADRHMSAAMGSAWDANADPGGDYEDVAIAEFRTDHARWRPGLGIVPVNVVPVLTYDYHWGRMFAAAQKLPGELSVGISEQTALILGSGQQPRVAGERSVVVLDARQARMSTAANGTIQAIGTVMDTFAPGEAVRSAR